MTVRSDRLLRCALLVLTGCTKDGSPSEQRPPTDGPLPDGPRTAAVDSAPADVTVSGGPSGADRPAGSPLVDGAPRAGADGAMADSRPSDGSGSPEGGLPSDAPAAGDGLISAMSMALKAERSANSIVVTRVSDGKTILAQNFESDLRPWIHPVYAPSGTGQLTEFSPLRDGGEGHQTALFFAFTNLNGRDYFHHKPSTTCWRGCFRVKSAQIERVVGNQASWIVADDWMATGDQTPVMTETQRWTLTYSGPTSYTLDLDWYGLAQVNLNVGVQGYGGLFWRTARSESKHTVNSEGIAKQAADGKRARWVDMMIVPGGRAAKDSVHVAYFDHKSNPHHPCGWRVDEAQQVGAVPTAEMAGGAIRIAKGEMLTLRYRMYVYEQAGPADPAAINAAWEEFSAK